MDYTIKLVKITGGRLDASASVELPTLGKVDIRATEFPTNLEGNQRYNSAVTLFEKCRAALNRTTQFALVYRSVAVGGINRNLAGFAAKPLTLKFKSINPDLIYADEDFKRLTGLLPCLNSLSKGGGTGSIPLKSGQFEFAVQKTHTLGSKKEYLYYNGSKFSWDPDFSIGSSSNLATFAGTSQAPYLADWDLVTVGIKPISSNANLEVNFSRSRGYLPKWLETGIENCSHTSEQVTQHGPESLYCGNDILPDHFLVVYGTESPAFKVFNNEKDLSFLKESPLDAFYWYQFPVFNGKAQKPTSTEISQYINDINAKFN